MSSVPDAQTAGRAGRRPGGSARGPAFSVAALALAGLLLVAASAPALAQVFETKAKHAILVDTDTDTVLFQKAADEPTPPASLAKLMTMAVLFEALKAGRISEQQTFRISENAWRKGGAVSGGSTMFAKVNSDIAISDLMRGVIVQSGNDAAIAVAEGMAGTEAAFAELMNERAKRIGLSGSNFTNATGLPDPQQYVTVRDLAILAKYIITNFPDYFPIYSEKSFLWNKIRQTNRNPLLEMNIGADGMKTGYIQESGYGIVGTALRDGRRLIVVINGAASERERADEARKLLDWGFHAFRKSTIFGPGDTIAEAEVYGGTAPKVGLTTARPIEIMLPTGSLKRVQVKVLYSGPLVAPVKAGQKVGELTVSMSGDITSRVPLVAAADVDKGTLTSRALDAVEELLLGWL